MIIQKDLFKFIRYLKIQKQLHGFYLEPEWNQESFNS